MFVWQHTLYEVKKTVLLEYRCLTNTDYVFLLEKER